MHYPSVVALLLQGWNVHLWLRVKWLVKIWKKTFTTFPFTENICQSLEYKQIFEKQCRVKNVKRRKVHNSTTRKKQNSKDFLIKNLGAGEMAYCRECLLCKHEDLGSNPQYSNKKLSTATCICKPSIRYHSSLVSQPCQIKLWLSERPCLKEIRKSNRGHLMSFSDHYTHTQTQVPHPNAYTVQKFKVLIF